MPRYTITFDDIPGRMVKVQSTPSAETLLRAQKVDQLSPAGQKAMIALAAVLKASKEDDNLERGLGPLVLPN